MSRLNINLIQISIKAYGAFYKYDNLLLQKVVNSRVRITSYNLFAQQLFHISRITCADTESSAILRF